MNPENNLIDGTYGIRSRLGLESEIFNYYY